jgi:uncharacterized protein (TIGR03382 family)
MKTRVATVALASLAFSAPLASAAITGVTGATNWLGSPPVSCVPGALAGFTAYTWNEQQNVTIASGINVDMTNNPGSSTSPIPGNIAGIFDVHFLHFQGIPGIAGVTGTVTYSGPIIGVIFNNTTLDLSDYLGTGGTVYPTGYPFRGLGGNPTSFFSISGNTLSFNFNTISPVLFVDQVRVLTHVTPAPGSVALLGLAGLVCGRRRR